MMRKLNEAFENMRICDEALTLLEDLLDYVTEEPVHIERVMEIYGYDREELGEAFALLNRAVFGGKD
jgi:hypothetical protein